MGFLGGLALNFVGGLFGASAQRKQQQRLLRQQREQQLRAYRIASTETEGEIAYREKLGKRATEGDPMLTQRKNLLMSPIRQMGEEGRVKAQGMAIGQGLENSIIAQQLRERVDAKTLQGLSKTAKQIAMYNDEYKRRDEDKLDSYTLQRGQMLRDLAVGLEANRPIDTTMTDSEMFGSLFGQMMSNVSSGWMNSESGQASMNNFFSGGFDW